MPIQMVRWIPSEHSASAIKAGFKSHNKSALWIYDLYGEYRPGERITKGSHLVAYDLDATAIRNITTVRIIDFESSDFKGEAAHPLDVIRKNNELGAYGVGLSRQSTTNHHVKTRYATKKEVAKALNCSEINVHENYRPGKCWPL